MRSPRAPRIIGERMRPRGRRPQPRNEQTHEDVLVAAEHLLEREGFSGMTMEALARETGVAKATLYKYFSGKEAVVSALAERNWRAVAQHVVEAAGHTNPNDEFPLLSASIDALVDYVGRRADYFDKWFRETTFVGDAVMRARVVNAVAAIFEARLAAYDPSLPHVEVQTRVRVAIWAVLGAIHVAPLELRTQLDDGTLAATLKRMVSSLLRRDPPHQAAAPNSGQ